MGVQRGSRRQPRQREAVPARRRGRGRALPDGGRRRLHQRRQTARGHPAKYVAGERRAESAHGFDCVNQPGHGADRRDEPDRGSRPRSRPGLPGAPATQSRFRRIAVSRRQCRVERRDVGWRAPARVVAPATACRRVRVGDRGQRRASRSRCRFDQGAHCRDPRFRAARRSAGGDPTRADGGAAQSRSRDTRVPFTTCIRRWLGRRGRRCCRFSCGASRASRRSTRRMGCTPT